MASPAVLLLLLSSIVLARAFVVQRRAVLTHFFPYAIADEECDNDNHDEDKKLPTNESLLDELRNVRRKTFGVDVPMNDDLRTAAQNAERDFLLAMREQTSEFRQMKDDVGSEGACDAFMERIREADEQMNVDRAATSVHMDSIDGIEDSNADSWL
jgi:hypothetical protein